MKTVTIDGASIKSMIDFHKIIKRLLNFPDYYGENLDALWDCLSDIQTPITIIWKDHEVSATNLSSDFNKIANVFNDAKQEFNGFSLEYK